MSILKCKMCGGALEVSGEDAVCECEYCGTRQTIPKLDSERRSQLFDRANYFRMNSEFDKASQVYENIISEAPEEAEAHWGLCLCRYGIEYVEDPKTRKRVPTCHRTQFKSIFDDVDYLKAMGCCDPVAREVYKAEAEYIDGVQKKILEISNKEDPFDIFICYKETDAAGNRTVDSVIAQDIYDKLTEKGYKVFFARITLEDKLGSAYEPYIFAALNSAKIMLIVGTKPEYFNAVWVKNEWSRYLAMIESGQKKHIIPCYRDMSPYDMPDQFSSLQAQDVSKVGYMQDLLRGLAKIINESAPQPQQQAAAPAAQSERSKVQNMIKLAFLDYEGGNVSNAEQLFKQALQIDSECTEAYFGLILSTTQNTSYVKALDRLAPEPTDFEKNYIAENHEKCFSILAKAVFTSRLKYLLSLHPDMLTKNYKLSSSSYNTTTFCPFTNYIIIEMKDANILKCVLEAGGDPNAVRVTVTEGVEERWCALDDAIIIADSTEFAEALLEHKADPNAVTYNYYENYKEKPVQIPVLSRAVCDAKNNKAAKVKALLEHGANPETHRVYIDEYGKQQHYSVLSDAIWNAQNADVVKILLEHGADPNAPAIEHNETPYPELSPPLNQAIRQKNIDMVTSLLEHGADPNSCYKKKNHNLDIAYSALGEALWEPKCYSLDIVKALLDHGADAARVEQGYDSNGVFCKLSMLSYAIMYAQHIPAVNLLIEHGATWDHEIEYCGKRAIERKFPYGKFHYYGDSFKKELKKLGWVGSFYIGGY